MFSIGAEGVNLAMAPALERAGKLEGLLGNDNADQSVAWYRALKKAGVPAEMHLYQSGGHGFGMRPGKGPTSDWPKRCAEWMAARGLLGKK